MSRQERVPSSDRFRQTDSRLILEGERTAMATSRTRVRATRGLPLLATALAVLMSGCTSVPEATTPEGPRPAAPAAGPARPAPPPLGAPEPRSVPEFCLLQETTLDLSSVEENPTSQVLSVVRKLHDQAPDGARSDLSALAEALDQAVGDPAGFDRSALETAADRVLDWSQRNCT